MSPSSAAADAGRPARGRVEGKAAHPSAAAKPRRPRWRISLAEIIFKILCLIIAAFFILLFGTIGGVLYLTS